MNTDIRDSQNIQDPAQEGVQGLKGLGNSSAYYKNMEALDTFEDQESANRLKSLLTANYTGRSEDWVQDVGVVGLNDSMYDEEITNPKHLQNLTDARGEIQSGVAQVAAGLGKAVATAGTTFAETANFLISGALWTLQEGYDAITGKSDDNHTFYDTVLNNSFSQALTDIQEAAEVYMPNYRTDEENAADWWENMFSAQGAANFWGDVIIKNLGFTVGAMLGGGAFSAGLKALGVTSKAAHWMLGTAVGALGEASIEAKHNALDVLDIGEQALDTSEFDFREQAIQNSEIMTDEEKLIALSKLQYDKNLAIQQARADMEKAAITTANSSFALNFAICWATDLFTMGKILTRGSHGYNKQIQKTIENASNAAGETAEATTDTVKRSKLSKFWKKVNENYEEEIAPVGYDRKTGKWFDKSKTKAEAAAIGVAKGLAEGLQEGLQKAAGEGSKYYALSNDSPEWFRESEYADDAYQKGVGALKAVVEGFKVFADPETYQEVFAGMFSMVGIPTFGRRQNAGSTTILGRGKMIGLSGGILGEINDARELNSYYGGIADKMNEVNMENIITHIGRMQVFNDKAEEIIKSPNRNTKFEWLNQKENSLYSIAAAYARAGRTKEFYSMLDAIDVENMTEEQIESYAQMAGAANTSEDDSTNNEVRINTGFYDTSGNLDIQEAKNTIANNVSNTKKALESYVENLEEIRSQLGRGRLSLDEEDELAWLKWKAEQHSIRKGEILKKFTDILERCKDRKININNVEVDAVELFQKIANGNWKSKEDYHTEEEYNNSIDSLQDKSTEVLLASLDKITSQLKEDGETIDSTALLSDFVDMVKLRNTNYLFLNKYMEYLNNPKKLQQKKLNKQKAHEAINSLKDKAREVINKKKEKENIENNLNEIVKNIESLDDQEKQAEALGKLQSDHPEAFKKIDEFLKIKGSIAEAISSIDTIEAQELATLNYLFEAISENSNVMDPNSLYNNFYKALEEGYTKSLEEGVSKPTGVKVSTFVKTETWEKAMNSIETLGNNITQNNNLKNSFNSQNSTTPTSTASNSTTSKATLAEAINGFPQIAKDVTDITNFKDTSFYKPTFKEGFKYDVTQEHQSKKYKAFRALYEDKDNSRKNIYMYALVENDGKLSDSIFLLPFFKNGNPEYEELSFSSITGYSSIYDKLEELKNTLLEISIDENVESTIKKSDYYRTLHMYSYSYKPFGYTKDYNSRQEFMNNLNAKISNLAEDLATLYDFTPKSSLSSLLVLTEVQKKNLKDQITEVKGHYETPSISKVLEDFMTSENIENTNDNKVALEKFLTAEKIIETSNTGSLQRTSIDVIPDDDVSVYEDRDNLKSNNVNNNTNPTSNSSASLDYWISPIRQLPIHYKNGEAIPYHKTKEGEKALKDGNPQLYNIHDIVWNFIDANNPQWTNIVKSDSNITFKVIKEVQEKLQEKGINETVVFMYVGDLPIGILKLDNDKGKIQEGLKEFKEAINKEFNSVGYADTIQDKECFNSAYSTRVKTIGAGKTLLNPPSSSNSNTQTLNDLNIKIEDNILVYGYDKDPKYNYPNSAKEGQVFLKVKNKDTTNIHTKNNADTYNAIPVSSKTLREMYASSEEVKKVLNYVAEELKKAQSADNVKEALSFLNLLFRARFKYSIKKVTDTSITLYSTKNTSNFIVEKNADNSTIITEIFKIFGNSQFHYLTYFPRKMKRSEDKQGIEFNSNNYYTIAQQAILTDVSNADLTTTDRFIAIEPININNSITNVSDVKDGTEEEIKTIANNTFSDKSNDNALDYLENDSTDSIFDITNDDISIDDDTDGISLRQEFENTEETEKIEKYNDDILQKEINWLAKVLPQFTNVERLHIVNKISAMGKKAWGMFKRGLIYIERTGAKGTVYHEAFHAVTDCLLTPEEYQLLLDEGRKKWTDEKLSDLDIEEKLAEDFRVFVELMEMAEEDMTPKQLEDYKRILAGVKGLKGEYNTGLTRLEAFYWNIHRGKFANRTLNETLNRGKKDALIEYEKEINAIKQKAIEDGTFMKAPNGKPTNLTEQQWLQVRTKAFKEWFGDWEKVANLDPTVYYHSSRKQFNNFDIINNNNSGNYNSYGYGIHLTPKENHLEGDIVYQVRVPADKGDNYLREEEKKVFNDLVSLAAKYHINIDRFKDKKISPTIIIKHLVERMSRRDFLTMMQESKYDGFIDFAGNVAVIYKDNSAQIVNNISKVVDENGEPLVVYHGGVRNINTFKLPNNKAIISFDSTRNLEWAKREGYVISEENLARYNNGEGVEVTKPVGVYFAADEVVSRSYFGRKNIEDNELYATFLNIKNPYITDKNGEQMPDDAATVKDLQKAKDNNQDGVIIKNVRDYGPNDEERMNWETNEFATHPTTDYIVFNSNQVKSATDNIGLFDSESDDIRFRENIEDTESFWNNLVKETGINLTKLNNKEVKLVVDSITKSYGQGKRKVGYYDSSSNFTFPSKKEMQKVLSDKSYLYAEDKNVTLYSTFKYTYIIAVNERGNVKPLLCLERDGVEATALKLIEKNLTASSINNTIGITLNSEDSYFKSINDNYIKSDTENFIILNSEEFEQILKKFQNFEYQDFNFENIVFSPEQIEKLLKFSSKEAQRNNNYFFLEILNTSIMNLWNSNNLKLVQHYLEDLYKVLKNSNIKINSGTLSSIEYALTKYQSSFSSRTEFEKNLLKYLIKFSEFYTETYSMGKDELFPVNVIRHLKAEDLKNISNDTLKQTIVEQKIKDILSPYIKDYYYLDFSKSSKMISDSELINFLDITPDLYDLVYHLDLPLFQVRQLAKKYSDRIYNEFDVTSEFNSAIPDWGNVWEGLVETHNNAVVIDMFNALKNHIFETIEARDWTSEYIDSLLEPLKEGMEVLNSRLGVNISEEEIGKLELSGVRNIDMDVLKAHVVYGSPLINPSIAIINPNISTHKGYGDITLLMSNTLIENYDATLYPEDAYTPAFSNQRDLGKAYSAGQITANEASATLNKLKNYRNVKSISLRDYKKYLISLKKNLNYNKKSYAELKINENVNFYDGVIGMLAPKSKKESIEELELQDFNIPVYYYEDVEDDYNATRQNQINAFVRAYKQNKQKVRLQNDNGVTKGFTKDGEIFINKDSSDSTTSVHEYTHLWVDALRKSNPELYQRGMILAKENVELWNQIVENNYYGNKWADLDIADFEHEVFSEAAARLTSKEADNILNNVKNKSLLEALKQWISDFAKYIKDTFTSWTKEEADKISNEEFFKMPIRDLYQGINPSNDIRFREAEEGIQENLVKDMTAFLSNFDITIKDISEYEGELPLFDALNRVIYAKDSKDITDGVGEAIAFMMQHHQNIKELISALKTGNKNILTKYNFNTPFRLEISRYLYTYKTDKSKYLRVIGEKISEALKDRYNIKQEKDLDKINKNPFWEIIVDFFNKINPFTIYKNKIISNIVNNIVEGVVHNDIKVIVDNYVKPSTSEEAEIVDIGQALLENPYEENIISTLGKYNIGLAGGAAVAAAGTLYRPSENPLHDIDFNAKGKSKEEIEDIISKEFGFWEHTNTIVEKNKDKSTYTYIIMDREFIQKKVFKDKKVYYSIVDKNTGELLGTRIGSNLQLVKGVKGKMLDFFVGKDSSPYDNVTLSFNGKEYIFSDYRNAMEFKVDKRREKDIWDYNRFIKYRETKKFREASYNRRSSKQATVRLNKLSGNKFNVNPDTMKGVILTDTQGHSIFNAMGRTFILCNVNGTVIPFYQSSKGTSGKIKGNWYPFFGYTGNWLIKGGVDKNGKMSYSAGIDRITELLNKDFVIPTDFNNKGVSTSTGINVKDLGLNMYTVFDRFGKDMANMAISDPNALEFYDRDLGELTNANALFVKEITGIQTQGIKQSHNSYSFIQPFIDSTNDKYDTSKETFNYKDYHQEIQDYYEQKWAYVNLTQEQKQVLESMGINPRMYDSLSLEEKEVLHHCRM